MDKKIPCVQCYDGVVHPFFGRTVQLSGSLDSTSLAAAGIVDAKSKLWPCVKLERILKKFSRGASFF